MRGAGIMGSRKAVGFTSRKMAKSWQAFGRMAANPQWWIPGEMIRIAREQFPMKCQSRARN